MVQFVILTGRTAGAQWVARRFPVRVGRAPENDLVLEEDGVWGEHFRVSFSKGEGFRLERAGEALVRVNGNEMADGLLRNGDVLDVGAARLQFWLARANPSGLKLREAAVWSLIALLTLGQVALIYMLLSL